MLACVLLHILTALLALPRSCPVVGRTADGTVMVSVPPMLSDSERTFCEDLLQRSRPPTPAQLEYLASLARLVYPPGNEARMHQRTTLLAFLEGERDAFEA